jgi:formamidopyrimidine-DNA glycosylase
LQEGIDHEGASINWYRKADGTTGEYQERFMAYDREGEPCLRCGTPIVKIKLAQRGTHYCPRCQH